MAFEVAHSMGHLSQGIGSDHLLVGMASVPQSSASRALRSVGVTAEGLQEKLSSYRPCGAQVHVTVVEEFNDERKKQKA